MGYGATKEAYAPMGADLSNNSIYVWDRAEYRDKKWTAVYLFTLLSTLSIGLYAYKSKNVFYDTLATPESLASYKTCHPNFHEDAFAPPPPSPETIDINQFYHEAQNWIITSVIGSLLLGFVFLTLIKYQARFVVKFVVALQVALPLIGGFSMLSKGAVGPGIFCLAMAGLAAFVFYMWRAQLEMCAQLLSVSVHGLKANPGLAFVVVLVKFALLILVVPHIGSMVAAFMNGSPAENPGVTRLDSSDSCYIYDYSQPGQPQQIEASCCYWKVEGWVPPYIALAVFCLLWTVMLAFDIRLYTVSGSITQWYFAEAGAPTTGATYRSLKHSLTTSFGSICLGSLVLTFVQILRNITNNTRRRTGGVMAVIGCIVAAMLSCVYSIIEFLSKFATIQCAITGESFCDSAKSVTDMLKRNFMNSYGVWWVPPMILHTFSFVLALVWGIVAGSMSKSAFSVDTNRGSEAALLGLIAFCATLVVLGFFNSLLLNIVDTVYLCYVMDKDKQRVTKQDVHEVFSMLPVSVVTQPDGSSAYAPPSVTRV